MLNETTLDEMMDHPDYTDYSNQDEQWRFLVNKLSTHIALDTFDLISDCLDNNQGSAPRMLGVHIGVLSACKLACAGHAVSPDDAQKIFESTVIALQTNIDDALGEEVDLDDGGE